MLNDELLHKWINGSLSAEELEVFKTRPEYNSLLELHKNTDNLSTPAFDQETMLAEILKEKKVETWVKYAAAASILLLATWFLWPKSQLVTYELAKGEEKEGVLPDESMFKLNGESTLAFDKGLWKKDRTLELNGEAFFSVKKGSKFTVKTPNGSVQVLGTQFNVWSREGVLEVKCQSGRVAVLSIDGKVLDELNPKDAIRVKKNAMTDKWELQNPENANWGAAISSYKNAKLSTVLNEMEQRYNIEINAEGIDLNELISCSFRYKDLDLALKTCLLPLGIKHTIDDGGRVLLER